MSRGAKGRADAKRGKSADAEPRALPSAWRAILLCALLLLGGYTCWTAFKLMHMSGPPSSAPVLKDQADLVAARANAVLSLARGALRAGSERLAAAPERPLDAVESALVVAQTSASGGAVASGSQILAAKGDAAVGVWLKAAMAARAINRPSALIPIGSGLYVVSSPVGPKRLQLILAVDLDPAVSGASADHDIALVGAEGRILASEGPAKDSATLLAMFGLAPNTLRGLTGGDTDKGRNADGQPLRIAAAATSDEGVMAMAAEPAPLAGVTPSRRLADELFTLLAPLAAGLLLTLILVRQTRKTNEARLARADSERTFRLAVEAARCGIWEWRLDEDVMHMSDVTGAMLGWGGGGAARGADVIGRIASEHQERVRQALRGAAQFGGFDVSFRVEKAGGEASWIDARGQGFEPGPAGFGVIIGVALDVTDERNAEIRAQQAERRLADAIENVPEAFVLWDRHGRLLMCNGNFREFFSLEARLLKPGAPKQAVERAAELAIKRREPSTDPDDRGVEVELNDGRWLQISERRTAEGGWVMTAADITALKHQESALRQNEEALQDAVHRLEDSGAALAELAEKHQAASAVAESASRAKSEFLANMSHELRTPLNAINGFSEMMTREMFGPLGDRRYKEYAGDILSSGEHLLALINDILDMSKIEAGKMNMRPEPLDFADLAEEAMRLLRTRAEGAGLAMAINISPDLPEVEADFRALKQILLNLMSNAVKFTPRGGKVQLFAKVLAEDGGRVRIGVSDTGIGISDADLERLARPFEQIESQHSKTQQGTGLGLALTKSLVELHGGSLHIASKAGAGTTVSFTLPQAASTRARAASVA